MMASALGKETPILKPLLQKQKEENVGPIKRIALKVWEVAKFIIKTIACCWLYWMNSTLFGFGFVVGLVFSKEMKSKIEEINSIWKQQAWQMCILLGIGTFLSLPVAIASGSVLSGGYLGYTLAQEALSDESKEVD